MKSKIPNLQSNSSKYINFRKSLHHQLNSLTPISFQRLLIPLMLQTFLILLLPLPSLYTQLTGRTIILQTTPVDPYDIRRGSWIDLSYDISNPQTLKKLPGWKELVKKYPGSHQQYYPVAEGTNLYVVMQQDKNRWKPLKIAIQLPKSLPENQIVIRGKYRYDTINYGIEKYYMPEPEREKMSQEILGGIQVRVGQIKPMLIETKIDPQGQAVPVRMQVGDRIYNF
ncbi:GDYXXLXY domain-containing protein [Calothrix sp. PCC 6303]|uniref:GDYXXLXY domain-containing protein n=1 Tax=Calothrix sp. PCC 6303 TaxID=1170562 RepID=UPI0002A02E7D|nr:GDYXXLXY domain-containing protein [Calothrix sp. PCC 6303]AFZ00448.1 hypothetical protein Cal6303_1395 [Calothrix sp. PCC 6303]